MARGHRVDCGFAEYTALMNAIARCENPKHRAFHRYGGRGIKVCEKWRRDAEAFYADVGPRPSNRHSLDRIDNDGNYEPGNCRWATHEEQCANKTLGTLAITVRGETKTTIAWASECGISSVILRSRIRAGWSPEDAIGKPVRCRPKRTERASPRAIKKAKDMRLAGATIRQIADAIGVSKTTAHKIIKELCSDA